MNVIVISLIILLLIQAIFQSLLALGKPWGKISWGGNHIGVLPNKLRVSSGIASIVYLFFTIVFIDKLLTLDLYSKNFQSNLLLFLIIFFFTGTIMNLISRSKRERWWSIYTLITLICCVVLYLQ